MSVCHATYQCPSQQQVDPHKAAVADLLTLISADPARKEEQYHLEPHKAAQAKRRRTGRPPITSDREMISNHHALLRLVNGGLHKQKLRKLLDRDPKLNRLSMLIKHGKKKFEIPPSSDPAVDAIVVLKFLNAFFPEARFHALGLEHQGPRLEQGTASPEGRVVGPVLSPAKVTNPNATFVLEALEAQESEKVATKPERREVGPILNAARLAYPDAGFVSKALEAEEIETVARRSAHKNVKGI